MSPLNEAIRAVRPDWHLAFDPAPAPFKENMNTHPVANNFAVDYSQGGTVIDINNPPKKPYNPHAPENQYPRMLYPATWPAEKYVIVNSAEEQAKFVKNGFLLKPPVQNEPSSEDLDTVAAEGETAAKTSGKKAKA